jgi:GATA-binding protein, other eukaryote
MAGLLTVQRHRDSMGDSPALPLTSNLMRQPSAEDLDAAHQLVSSARGRADATTPYDFTEGLEEGTSIRPKQGASHENQSVRNGPRKSLANHGNSPTQNGGEDATPGKGSAPSGQTCRFVHEPPAAI